MVGTIVGILILIFVIMVLTLVGGGVLIAALIKCIKSIFSKPDKT